MVFGIDDESLRLTPLHSQLDHSEYRRIPTQLVCLAVPSGNTKAVSQASEWRRMWDPSLFGPHLHKVPLVPAVKDFMLVEEELLLFGF